MKELTIEQIVEIMNNENLTYEEMRKRLGMNSPAALKYHVKKSGLKKERGKSKKSKLFILKQ